MPVPHTGSFKSGFEGGGGSPDMFLTHCGNTYSEEGAYVGKGTVYTGMGPLQVKYYDTICQMGTCKIPYTQAAEEK